jgi:thiamine transport system ATP-binding protein
VVAVDGVSLEVGPAEVVALLGASGSGKSSLLRAVAGLEPLAAGRIEWDGADLAAVPTHRRGFVMMFQDGQLFPHLSVAGNVAYGIRHLPKPERAARVAELLELVGLPGYGPRPITALSGGQAQRVALARSLAPSPKLLLLDEPLSALDRGLREHLVGVLGDTVRATGTPALYVTHDQDEAFALADRVGVMSAGRLLQLAAPADLWRNPETKEVAEFLGYGPFLAPDAARALGLAVPPGHVSALGPRALRESEGGVAALVEAVTPSRGGAKLQVRLPGGEPAVLLRDDPARPETATTCVTADPLHCAILPA